MELIELRECEKRGCGNEGGKGRWGGGERRVKDMFFNGYGEMGFWYFWELGMELVERLDFGGGDEARGDDRAAWVLVAL